MEMCGKVAGRWRTILGRSPEEMDVPLKVDEELYFEGKFDTEAMLNLSLIHISSQMALPRLIGKHVSQMIF